MDFFFPDSSDQISPYFDFEVEEHPRHRIRQRDDLYAHEALSRTPHDGILISKAMVDGSASGAGRYTLAQRQRLYRVGAHQYFRTASGGRPLAIMGDCGAFTYADHPDPPYTVTEVADFYEGIGLDMGVSLDHIVFGYINEKKRAAGVPPEDDWRRRRELTVELAADFLDLVRNGSYRFEPIGVAHGWDPASYGESVRQLQSMGYGRIAVGGLVPLRTPEIREVVAAVGGVRTGTTEIHLLGVTRTEFVPEFASMGVTSFDSTSPFRQAFMDATDNYHTLDRAYMALRVPQVDGNAQMKRQIAAGHIDQRMAQDLERTCLEVLRRFDEGSAKVSDAVSALANYGRLYDDKIDSRLEGCGETLQDAPWKECDCGICRKVGIEVAIFRGAERNKRRGFHNLSVFRDRLDARLSSSREVSTV